MKKNNFKGCLILGLTSIIWGTAFIAQKSATGSVPPFAYTFSRSILAVLVLFPITLIFNKEKDKRLGGYYSKELLLAGLSSGVFLFIATALQQAGLEFTTTGKSAFITAMYIIFAPMIGILIGKKAGFSALFGAGLGALGMYLLCMSGESGIGKGDIMTLLCAVFFSFQILAIDRFSGKVDCIKMSCLQFLVTTVLSGIAMLIFEEPTLGMVKGSYISIIYTGVFSSAFAYTMQIVGQKYADVVPATLTMSLESVFAALAGWILLDEKMSQRELFGCLLIFIAIIISQINITSFLPKKENDK